MDFFDFHHHKINKKLGIYNLPYGESPVDYPFSAGIHPKEINVNYFVQLNWLYEVAENSNCVAIGECGLDAFSVVEYDVQNLLFSKQIELANFLRKPIVIHCVRRFYELIPFRKSSEIPMIIHGFNKKEKIFQDLLKYDFYFSFGVSVFQDLSLQNSIEALPLEKLFLETDNDDFNLALLYDKVAEIKNITSLDLKSQIFKNLIDIRNI